MSALTSLAERLGVPVTALSPLKAYAAADLGRLDAAIEAAMRTEDAAVEKGLRDAVRFVPRPLRGRATALLFPEGDRG